MQPSPSVETSGPLSPSRRVFMCVLRCVKSSSINAWFSARRGLSSPCDESGNEQCLDCAPLIHCAVAFGNLLEWQREIEYFPRLDPLLPNQVDQFGQIASH